LRERETGEKGGKGWERERVEREQVRGREGEMEGEREDGRKGKGEM